ncbi:hypothetical protein ACU10_03535 [Xanthomonas oryzae pv. oryzicola]|nr:hypothetical protein ACU10_03535 [Xanthomonas oryzae pv. oryzicola]AKO14949.1 hypothetical protein ACU12_03540 [Xanthomonas oryzae pv. oryzicola]
MRSGGFSGATTEHASTVASARWRGHTSVVSDCVRVPLQSHQLMQSVMRTMMAQPFLTQRSLACAGQQTAL